jgi:hypothetical protein
MEKVKLQFQTPQDLANFRNFAGIKIVKTEVVNLVLHCECDKELIAVAITKFGAMVTDLPA